jgi:uncharacterized membrane protein
MSVTHSLDGGSLPVQSGAEAQSGQAARRRVNSIDLLRGLVMLLMALDHTRDFFAAGSMNPRDIAEPAVFLTRWVTNFCAPTFILLAGVSAHLHGARGRSTQEISHFLLTRGLWLILIELTLVRFAWRFNFDLKIFVFQVIWAIGASMVVLAGLVHLPRRFIAVVGLGVILGHNLLDGIHAEHFVTAGWVWSWVWSFLHQPALLRGGSWVAYPLYSLLPWVGVMALGYAMGPIMELEQARRRRLLLGLGAGVCAGFVLLRASNLYGDPIGWTAQDGWLATALSFIDCEKYPASLLYLMMTLGPAMLALAAIEGASGRLARWVTTIGRVPLLYYVLHLYLIHGLAVLFATITVGDSTWLFAGAPLRKPVNYGLPLPGVYAVWLSVVVALYPVCRWFAALKQNRREWWWSYM